MGNDRSDINSLATRAGFNELTDLQRKAFDCPDFYDVGKWLFVMGATGSGKTLIALLSYFHQQQLAAERGRPYRMLFAVPYRALASQKFDEIRDFARKLELSLKIVQSTSEYLLDDPSIIAGKVDIAVIINEKIFMFASADQTFLDKYDLIVLDEIALAQDVNRGIKTDFIMLRARRHPELRVIALGTPFYDWREYIDKFQFTEIRELTRPVELKTLPIFYNKTGVKHVEPDCEPVKAVDFPDGYNERFINRVNGIVTAICIHHLQRDNKILIFLNNRQEVRELSKVLLKELVERGILKPWIDEEQCRDYILRSIQADADDILYGTMDEDDYRAFAHGISYHNANIPLSMRYLIEKDFLAVDGKLKIVCSTETLAYGVNSNADVVIIPRMKKRAYDRGIHNELRFLYPNEYMNYAGRAGRLNPSLPEQKCVGYVYPLIESKYFGVEGRPNDQRNLWEALNRKVNAPDRTFSQLLSVERGYLPFYILSLFSNSNPGTSSGIRQSDIKFLLRGLPLPSSKRLNENYFCDEPIAKLLELKLIQQINDDDVDDEDEPEYAATDVGRQLAGYVILISDFEELLSSIRNFVTPEKFFEVDMLNIIVNTKGILGQGGVIVGNFDPNGRDILFIKNSLTAMRKIFQYFADWTTPELLKKLLSAVSRYTRRFGARQYNFFDEDEFKALRLLASIMLWRSAACSTTVMFDGFKIYYEQMRRLLEIVCYRLDVIKFSLPLASGVKKRLLRQELTTERFIEATAWLNELTEALTYQSKI